MSGDFTPDQKRYLEGFVSGLSASRLARGAVPGKAEPVGPDAIHIKAQDRTVAAGGKLNDQEKIKRDEHPFDAYPRLVKQAAANEAPKPADNFRWRYFGLFYVAPAQSFYMCRLRIPNGILSHWQFRGVADAAQRWGGGYTHVTTRANLQIREIAAERGPPLIEALADLGVNPKGSGADNIRNVTGAATAGIDPNELLDTRPYARAWHHHILNDRSLYGLPRKFNVSFDGGGAIPTLEETNDIAFTAMSVTEGVEGVAPGVWFRLGLGGITGHKDFARPTGAYVQPADAIKVADAIVRVFIESGDRTDRKKARLKYVLDSWGFERFLAAVEGKLGFTLPRIPDDAVTAPLKADRQAHIGVHPQKQPGLVWVGVLLPVGRMGSAQMHGLADIAATYGDGDIRLTVWQNLILSGVKADDAVAVEARLAALGLTSKASSVRAGLIACTGNTGCKFALANTKDTALAIAEWVEPRVALDTPVNIHLTGCPNSCAQHYIGDIGMIATRVPISPDSDDTMEGFTILVGGGYGREAKIAREIFPQTKVEDCPELVERILKAYLAHRSGPDETFIAFANRHEIAALKEMIATTGGAV